MPHGASIAGQLLLWGRSSSAAVQLNRDRNRSATGAGFLRKRPGPDEPCFFYALADVGYSGTRIERYIGVGCGEDRATSRASHR